MSELSLGCSHKNFKTIHDTNSSPKFVPKHLRHGFHNLFASRPYTKKLQIAIICIVMFIHFFKFLETQDWLIPK